MSLKFPSIVFSRLAQTDQSNRKLDSPYLFIKMLLVDVRATLPSLQEQLADKDYPSTSSRIAESYDIISNFIGYLMRSLDEEESVNDSQLPLALDPTQLLQLRADLSETMSMTTEHVRERYDASVAGLDVSAGTASNPNSSTPLAIARGSSTIHMFQDPITLAELRTLSLWLREDDNDALRREAAGIVDVLLALYADVHPEQLFRSPVLIALEGILAVPEGVEAFMVQEGWDILLKDLIAILASPTVDSAKRGIDVVRVLLSVVESEVVGPAKEEWMEVSGMALRAMKGALLQYILVSPHVAVL